jgi:uncharacterized protein (DUF2062 family)
MIKKLERNFKFLVISLLRIHDKAHSIALGFSLGLIINFVPSFGFGPVISLGFAKLFRGNTMAGFFGGVTLVWAFPLFFYFNFVVGQAVLPVELTEIVEEIEGTEDAIEAGLNLGKAFFIGMIINMIATGIAIYFVVLTIITKCRKRILKYIYRVWLPKR